MQDAPISTNPLKPTQNRAYGVFFLSLLLLFNPLTFLGLESLGLFPRVSNSFGHRNDLVLYLPILLDLFFGFSAFLAFFSPRPFPWFPKSSTRFLLLLLFTSIAVLFFTNPILTGRFLILRLLWIAICVYIAIRTFYLGVVKSQYSKYSNLKTTGFALLLIFFFAEAAFMFVARSHRFNGTLASRTWFIRYWSLNEMGYRDGPYLPEMLRAKKKILVLGDSFVAGHGIRYEKDRFSNLLQERVNQNQYHVFNMGLQGSDVRDARNRLEEFPYSPDLLIFVHYPNDIENTCQEAGLELRRAKSYYDLDPVSRFFVRRSYLLNYLYWAYPHPDELFDFKGFLRQCYSNQKVLDIHHANMDSLFLPLKNKGIPVLLVVFPFLEEVGSSGDFVNPVYEYARRRDIPFIRVADLVRGQPGEELMANQNDAHANEQVNAKVTEAIYGELLKSGWLTGKEGGP